MRIWQDEQNTVKLQDIISNQGDKLTIKVKYHIACDTKTGH